jgi:hypothetical protein
MMINELTLTACSFRSKGVFFKENNLFPWFSVRLYCRGNWREPNS